MVPSPIPSQRRRTVARERVSTLQDGLYELLSQRRVMISYTILPVALLFAFINVFPIMWAIAGSFFYIPPFGGSWEFAGLEQYIALFGNTEFRASMWRSLVFAVGSVVVQVIAGIGLALLITRDFAFKRAARAVAFLPYLIPTAVFAFIAIWMTRPQFGILNRILLNTGIIDSSIAFFSEPSIIMPSIILTNSWKLSIFVTIMAVARLQSIPDSFYEAAEMAGAGTWQKFRDITLPNLKGVLFIVILLRFVWMFIKFDIIWILTRGGPNNEVLTAPLYAYEQGFIHLLLGRAAAVSTILFVLLAVIAAVYFRVLEPSREVRVE